MATIRWLGKALAVKQVTTITVAGTWLNTETLTLTVNGRDLVLTLGENKATTDVAAMINESLAASNNDTTASTHTYTRNVGGLEIVEFTEFTAEVASSVVTLTGATAGYPFTLTASETSTSGTLTVQTTSANSATGPNHFDNADNWEGGSLPSTGDVVVFDTGDVSCLHGLDYLLDNLIDVDLKVTDDYVGQIGLPPTNESGAYPEYRPRFLQTSGDASTKTIQILPGRQRLTAQRPLYIEAASAGVTSIYIDTVRGSEREAGVVLIGGAVSGETKISRGFVSIEPAAKGGSSNAYAPSGDIVLGSSGDGECRVTFGDTTDYSNNPSLEVHGGTHEFLSNIAALTAGTMYDGVVRVNIPTAASSLTPDFSIFGGTLYPNFEQTSADGVYTVYDGGAVDLREANADRQLTRVSVRAGGSYFDPADLGAGILDLPDGLNRVTLQLKPNRRLTITDIP